MARTNKHRRKLPEFLPSEVRCVPLFVPDDPEFYAMVLGAIHELTYAFRYDKGDINKSNATSKLWRDVTYHPLMEAFRDGTNCEIGTPTDPQDCIIINPVHPAIGYFPNHPALQPDGSGVWPGPGWCVDCAVPGLGLATDTLIRVESQGFFIDFDDLLSSGVPSFTLHFSGEGEIDIRFASVPLGGTVWVFPDGNPLVGQMVDLEWNDLDDLAGTAIIEILIGLLQGELVNQTVVTHEMVFETGGSHTITGWFFPKVELAEWPPVGYGGGLRSVQLCGDSIEMEEAPLDFTLQCSSDTLELMLDGAPVSTIDLAACYPHPSPPAIPDYTLNRNNGDLQLLKDAVLHDSVQFPVYEVAYLESTHLLQLWRDSVLEDTAPLPSYTLTKPTNDEIRLHRNALTESIIEDKYFTYRLQENGDEHELTEDAAVVSSVTDDDTQPAGDAPMTYFEAVFDLTLPRAEEAMPEFMSDSYGEGLFVHEVGFVSAYDGPTTAQELGITIALSNRVKIVQLRITYLVTAGAGGDFAHEYYHPVAQTIAIPGGDGAASGPGEQVFDMTLNKDYVTARSIICAYYDGDAGPDDIVTLTKVEVMGLELPSFRAFGDATTLTMFNELDEAWS